MGGGTVGLALALALAEALGPSGRIGVVDPAATGGAPGRSTGPGDARASALSAASKRLLDALGSMGHSAPHAEPVAAVDITDSSPGDIFRPILVSYDNTVEGGEPATYILENERLRGALLEGVARRPGIERIGGTVGGWEVAAERGVVPLVDGRTLRAPLVVAADGRGSALREAAGIGVIGWQYRQVGIVTTVTHDEAAPLARRAAFSAGRTVRHPAPQE